MSIELILAAFAAGVFSAMIGALPVFILTGFAVLVGLAGGTLGGTESFSMVGDVGFGIFLGPDITFGAGVAAAIYAKKKGFLETGDITVPLVKFNNVGILLVGGLFGVLAYLLRYLFGNVLELPTDNIALTVVVSAIIARLLFSDKGLIPTLKTGNKGYFPKGDSLKVSLLLSLSIGALSAYYAATTGDVLLTWALSAIGLIFVQMGSGGYAFHHIGIVSALAAAATGNMYIGALFGMLAGITADTLGALFNKDGDSHIDPPAIAITIFTTVVLLVF